MIQSTVPGTQCAASAGSRLEQPGDGPAWMIMETRRVFDVEFVVRANSVAFRDEVRLALPPGESGAPRHAPGCTYSIMWDEQHGTHVLYCDGREILRTGNPAVLLTVLRADALRALAASSRAFSFLHAGVVRLEKGLIVIPGISGAGKTTLVRSFLALGAVYYSDEYAVLDGEGHCHAFPSALSIKDRVTGGERRIAPHAVTAQVGGPPAPIDLVVFSTYVPGAGFRLEEIDRGYAALTMLHHMPGIRQHPQQDVSAAALAVRSARCYELRHDDSEAAALKMDKYLGRVD